MTADAKENVKAALRNLMEPIIMMLLRNGVTYKEFSTFCKNVFVDMAARDFGIRGRPTNISRVSVITGIDRKEVKRIKDLLSENTAVIEAQQSQDRLSRILSGWHQDKDFVDNNGSPKFLPVDGEGATFTSLAKRYGGDVPVNALLKELVRAGSVTENDDGTFQVLQRYFFVASNDPAALLRAGTVVNELGNTLFHNIYGVNEKSRMTPRFEGRASNNDIDPRHIKAFKAFLDKEGQAFLERIDDWLTEHAEPNKTQDTPQKTVRLGVGVFAIEQQNSEDNS